MWLLSNKVYFEDCGFFEGFCDYHCHLLPGVDDGVGEMKETLEILRRWEQLGVSEVWITPHIMEDYPNEPNSLKEQFDDVVNSFDGSIRLHLAAENMLDGLFLKRFQADDLLTIDDDLLLVETSYYIPPMNMQQIVEKIKSKGYQPLLAHPERYQYMSQTDYRRWKEAGVLMQLNVPSLVGAYGQDVQSKAEWLLNKGFYDCCGTDIHSAEQMDVFLSSQISKKMVRKITGLRRI